MNNDLINQATKLALRLSPSRAQSVSEVLFCEPVSINANEFRWVGDVALVNELVTIIDSWTKTGFAMSTLGGILVGASTAGQSIDAAQSVDIVWTGPKTRHIPVRRTEQVLIDLISSAEHEIFLVSFVVYEHKPIIETLLAAEQRGVTIKALVEASNMAGGNLVKGDPVEAMRKALPNAQLYVWADREAEFEKGSVHAKIAVADQDQSLVSSANLTGHAMLKNMEAGILIKGGVQPIRMRDHLQALIDTGVLQPVS